MSEKHKQQLETELRTARTCGAPSSRILIAGLPPDYCSGEWCAREELEDELRVLWLRRKALTKKWAGSNTLPRLRLDLAPNHGLIPHMSSPTSRVLKLPCIFGMDIG